MTKRRNIMNIWGAADKDVNGRNLSAGTTDGK